MTPLNYLDEIMWKIPSRIASMFREKSRIVDDLADIIPVLADKFEKSSQELADAQSRHNVQVDLKERLEKSAKEIGYSIDWNKKAVVKG